MTFEDYQRYIEKTRENRNQHSDAKGEAYAHSPDRFDNFNRIAGYLNLSREQVLLVYLMKHIDGIISSVNYDKDGGEGIHGRINDAIVYLELLQGMVHENKDLEEERIFSNGDYIDKLAFLAGEGDYDPAS
jgi:hypothetical protein